MVAMGGAAVTASLWAENGDARGGARCICSTARVSVVRRNVCWALVGRVGMRVVMKVASAMVRLRHGGDFLEVDGRGRVVDEVLSGVDDIDNDACGC